jgi:zeaxanthin glucosyltransferase
MKVLIVSLQVSRSGSRGHLHPWLPVVQRLSAAGHEVLWLPLPSPMGQTDAALVTRAGARLLEPPPLPEGSTRSEPQLAEWARDEQQIWRAYSSFLLDPVPHQLAGVEALLEQLQPDCIAMDGMVYSAALACRRCGLPYVAVCAGLKMLHTGTFEDAYRGEFTNLVVQRAELFASYEVHAEFRLFECMSEQANVVFTVRSFGRAPAVMCVGPSLPEGERGDEPDFPWPRVPVDAPLVYASFGSVHSLIELPDVVPALLEGCRQRRAFLVLASQYYADQDLGPGVLVVPYAPQLALLRHCSIYVSHGGANSVTEALAHGVPQLVVPISSDQPLQARLVQRAGVGASLKPGASPSQFSRVLAWLGSDEGVLARVARIREEMLHTDGAADCADIILRTPVREVNS